MTAEEKNLYEKKDVKKSPKRPYQTPKLTVYGTIEKITRMKVAGAMDAAMS